MFFTRARVFDSAARRSITLAATALLVLGLVAPAASAQAWHQVTGRIFAPSETGTVPGTEVQALDGNSLVGSSTVTADGTYSLMVASSVVDVVFTPPEGSRWNPIRVEGVDTSANPTVDVTLVPINGFVTVSGVVRDGDGVPLVGVSVGFSDGTDAGGASTDELGRYSAVVPADARFLGVSRGQSTPVGEQAGFFSLSAPVELVPSSGGGVVLDLTVPLHRVAVRVVDGAGGPVAGAQVSSGLYTSLGPITLAPGVVTSSSSANGLGGTTGPDGWLVTSLLEQDSTSVQVTATIGSLAQSVTSEIARVDRPISVVLQFERGPTEEAAADQVDDHIHYQRADRHVTLQAGQTLTEAITCPQGALLSDVSPLVQHVDQGEDLRKVVVTEVVGDPLMLPGERRVTVRNNTSGQAQVKLLATCLRRETSGGGNLEVTAGPNQRLEPGETSRSVACPVGTIGLAPSWKSEDGAPVMARPVADGRSWDFGFASPTSTPRVVGLACLQATTGATSRLVVGNFVNTRPASESPHSSTFVAPDRHSIIGAGWQGEADSIHLGHELQDRQAVVLGLGAENRTSFVTVRGFTQAVVPSAVLRRGTRTVKLRLSVHAPVRGWPTLLLSSEGGDVKEMRLKTGRIELTANHVWKGRVRLTKRAARHLGRRGISVSLRLAGYTAPVHLAVKPKR